MAFVGLEVIEANLLMGFENILLLIVIIGSMIFSAKDFKLGMIILFIITGAMFVWFYEKGMFYQNVLIVMILSFIIMSLSLYAVQKSSTTGGLV